MWFTSLPNNLWENRTKMWNITCSCKQPLSPQHWHRPAGQGKEKYSAPRENFVPCYLGLAQSKKQGRLCYPDWSGQLHCEFLSVLLWCKFLTGWPASLPTKLGAGLAAPALSKSLLQKVKPSFTPLLCPGRWHSWDDACENAMHMLHMCHWLHMPHTANQDPKLIVVSWRVNSSC